MFQIYCFHLHLGYHVLCSLVVSPSCHPCFIDMTCYPSVSKGWPGPVLPNRQVHRSCWAYRILSLGPVRILISEFKLQCTMMYTACSNMYVTERIVFSCISTSNCKKRESTKFWLSMRTIWWKSKLEKALWSLMCVVETPRWQHK